MWSELLCSHESCQAPVSNRWPHAALVMQRPGATTALMTGLAAQEWATSLLGEQYAAYKADALARPGAPQPLADAESSHEGCMASMAACGSLKNVMQLPA